MPPALAIRCSYFGQEQDEKLTRKNKLPEIMFVQKIA